jgi:hypothetical protein
MFVKLAVAVALLASFVAAQSSSPFGPNTTFDPSTIDPTLRSQWCEAEFNTCKILCSNANSENTCNSTSLNYTCTCSANNSAPGLQYFTQTMPTFICEEEFSICNANAVNDANSAQAQAQCKSTEQTTCGQLNPANFTASAPSTASSTGSPTASGSSTGSSATSSSSKAAAATMAAVRNFGTGAFAVGAAAVFGVLL